MANVERTRLNRAFYVSIRSLARLACLLLFRVRCHGRHRPPASGGAVVCSNHQSYLDPILIGLSFDRRLNYLARQTLFRWGPFRWLIRTLDAIPLDREGLGISGMKETLRRLRRGEMVLLFPEGTRSRDGQLQRFLPGVLALIRRSGAAVVPVGVDGAHQAWPRNSRLPRMAAVQVVIGEPLAAGDVRSLSDEQLLQQLEQRVGACWQQARAGLAR